ncbi:MAG: OmpA family protein, partial [Bacteroidota bacterium]|nr:OmpA family protein [Candidatus Kapabacteria bacterium]MDW8220997.1 OmpA family protein [Bacteroidota bacterium]
LPARYKRYVKPDLDDFTGGIEAELNNFQNRFYNSDMMSVYYDVLNIIGKRLQEKPSATLVLTGCNDGLPGSEKGNKRLSLQRALAVRNYLVQTWDIDSTRLKVEARELPEYATVSVDTLDGAQENRRVEITSADPSILEPLLVFDTLSICSVPKIRIRMKAESEAGLEKSVMRAYQGSKTLKEASWDGPPPAVFDWNVQAEPWTIPKADEEINFELELYDKAGQKVVETAEVPVEQLNLKRKKELKIKDRTVDVFRLISFPFNSTKMGVRNEEIVRKYVNPYLSKESKIVATGYTDRLGNADVNQRLSEGRAKSVADALRSGQISSLGVGNRRPLYSNDLPEGRFYNRTVEVRVETPVNYGQ